MKKLFLLLVALLMLTSCDFLGMFKEEEVAVDYTAYIGSWERTIVDLDEESGITTTSTMTLELTETTFTMTDVGVLTGDDEDMIDMVLFFTGGDIDSNTLTISMRGTLTVDKETVSITPTHMTMGAMEEAETTGEDAEVIVFTWAVDGNELTLTTGGEVEVYTKK